MTPPKNMTEYARQAGKTWTFKSKNRTTKSCPKMKIPRANQRSKRFGIAEKVKPKMAMKNKATENWRKVHLEANRSPRQCDCDLLVQLACEGWWFFGGFDIFLFLPHSRGICVDSVWATIICEIYACNQCRSRLLEIYAAIAVVAVHNFEILYQKPTSRGSLNARRECYHKFGHPMVTINYRCHDPWPPSGVVTHLLSGHNFERHRIYGNLFKPAKPNGRCFLADNICHALSNYMLTHSHLDCDALLSG